VQVRIRINEAYEELRRYEHRYIVLYGGRRSGKSYAISQLLVLKAIANKRKIVCMRKVGTTLRLSVYPRIKDALNQIGIPYKENKTDMSFTLPNGSVFLCLGADDPEKLKSLEGATDYWLEEATEFDEADLDTIDAGLSADCEPPPQIYLSFNPIPSIQGFEHWIQKKFLHGEFPIGKIVCHENYIVLRTTYKQNAFCPEPVKKVLEGYKLTNPILYKMWALGEFTKVEGAILTKWDIVDKVPDGIDEIGYGLDFGFSADPACLVKLWAHNDDLYVREEVYSTDMTNQDLGREFRKLGVKGLIRADDAEPKSIMEIQQMGFAITKFGKSPDYKRHACQWLQSKNIHVLRGSTNVVRDISTWMWAKDKQGNQLPKPADGNDHACDAIIYGAYGSFKNGVRLNMSDKALSGFWGN
jgi:phage terminase large subunit